MRLSSGTNHFTAAVGRERWNLPSQCVSYHSGRSQGIPLKESAMNRSRVESLAADLSRVEPSFDTGGFVADVMAQLPDLELKARIVCVADALASHLPADIGAATTIILAALPPHDDATFTGSDFGLYTYAPYSDSSPATAAYAGTSNHL